MKLQKKNVQVAVRREVHIAGGGGGGGEKKKKTERLNNKRFYGQQYGRKEKR